MKTFVKSKTTLVNLSLSLLLLAGNAAYASGDHDHEEKGHKEGGHEEGGHEEEGRVTIKTAIANKAGIKTQQVSGGMIKQTLTVYGKAVADTSKISHIQARFPGIISRKCGHWRQGKKGPNIGGH